VQPQAAHGLCVYMCVKEMRPPASQVLCVPLRKCGVGGDWWGWCLCFAAEHLAAGSVCVGSVGHECVVCCCVGGQHHGPLHCAGVAAGV
jgi:hypothetical protein